MAIDISTLATGDRLVGAYRGTQYAATVTISGSDLKMRVEGDPDQIDRTATGAMRYATGDACKDSGHRFWSREGEEKATRAAAPRTAATPIVARSGAGAGPILIGKAGPGWDQPVHPNYCAACNCKVYAEEGICTNCGGLVGQDPGEPYFCSACRGIFYAERGGAWPETCRAGHRDATAPAPEPVAPIEEPVAAAPEEPVAAPDPERTPSVSEVRKALAAANA